MQSFDSLRKRDTFSFRIFIFDNLNLHEYTVKPPLRTTRRRPTPVRSGSLTVLTSSNHSSLF